jgi:hypothetical protein
MKPAGKHDGAEDVYISKGQAKSVLRSLMRNAGIPHDSTTARCMFDATTDGRGGHNCKFGPAPLWDRKLGAVNGKVLRSELMDWARRLVESWLKFQRAGRAAH